MLILRREKSKSANPAKRNSLLLASFAFSVSLPFGILSARCLDSWLAGLVLGGSLFTYSILLAHLIKKQPPFFLKRILGRKDYQRIRSLNEFSGLRLDYVGAKDPQDAIDGLIHTRQGELQRAVRCILPQHFSIADQSLLLEMLFADLCKLENSRFQLIFPERESNSKQSEMIVVASLALQGSGTKKAASSKVAPLDELKALLDHLIERLLTLGISPRLMNANEVKQLISEELGSCASRSQLKRDWRNLGNLGWEPSFRDNTIKAGERYMQVADRKSASLAIEQLPKSANFEWLAAILQDLPGAYVSIFVSPCRSDNLMNRLGLLNKIKKQMNREQGILTPIAAQMSFYLRFHNRDAYKLEQELSTARKYFASLGIASSTSLNRQHQLQLWQATLPCAQEQAGNRHTVAFMKS